MTMGFRGTLFLDIDPYFHIFPLGFIPLGKGQDVALVAEVGKTATAAA